MSWNRLFHLGDLSLTLPAACAIAAWLLAGRAWRAALGWSLVFGAALALVAVNKIAFIGWAAGLPALDFRAASGHATGFTAAFPTACYLMSAGGRPRTRLLATGAGLALAAVVAAALVSAGEHTLAEAVAGWLIGATACFCTVRLAGDVRAPAPGKAVSVAVLVFASSAWLIHAVPVSYWMIKLALTLSGNAAPASWHSC